MISKFIKWLRGETEYTGVVTQASVTFNNQGQQNTCIDGKWYITWWDANTKDWKIGDRVTFKKRKTKHGSYEFLEAYDIHKVVDDN